MTVVDRTDPKKIVVRQLTDEEADLIASGKIPIEHSWDLCDLRDDGTMKWRARVRIAFLEWLMPIWHSIRNRFN